MTQVDGTNTTTGDSFDVRTARLWVAFFVHAVQRHWIRATGGSLAVFLATIFK